MLLSPLRYINPISGNRGGSAISYFANCYYIFDTDKDFVLNNEDITSYLSGSSNDVSINIIFKRNTIGSKMCLFGSADNSFAIYLTASNEIQLETYDTTVQKLATTTNTFTDTTNDYYLSVIYNGVTPANSKIIVNDTDETLAVNTLTSTIDTTSNNYYLGSKGSGDYFDGKIKQFSINQGTETTEEHTTWIENLVSPVGIFSDIVKLLNISLDPQYDPNNLNFAALDTVNPVVSNKMFRTNYSNSVAYGLMIEDNVTMASLITADFTVGMLVRIENVSTDDGFLFGKYNSSSVRDFKINVLSNGEIQAAPYAGGTQVKASGAFPSSEWVFLVVVLNQGNSKIYVNAVDETTSNGVSAYVTPTASDWYIGTPMSGFTGATFDYSFIQVINKGLSSTEVTEWYNGGNPTSAADTSFSANLGWQSIAQNLVYDGVVFNEVDSISGQTLTSSTNIQTEAYLQYGGKNVVTSRNLLYTDRECNGVANTGVTADVVYGAGQSNKAGAENRTNLQAEYDGYRGDIGIWNGTTHEIIDDAMNSVTYPANPSAFGDQYSLLYKLADYTGNKTFLHEYAVGGTRLYEDAGDDWNANSVGEYLDLALAEMQDADAALVGYNINRKGFIWNQHEADCTLLVRANAYQANLIALVNKVRTVYSDIPFYVVLVHADLAETYASTVKVAQLAAIASLDNVYGIDQDGCGTQGDGVHRNAAGYEELGRLEFEALKDN